MDNQKIAQIFQEIGDMLEIQGENRFRVLAYQKAALTISDLGTEVADIYNQDPKELEKIPGIGKDLASKIVELIETGKCTYHVELMKKFSPGLLDMLRVRGVGPKKIKLFFGELKIDTIEKLRKAAEDGKISELPGMGEKSEKDILKALDEYDKHTERMTLMQAMSLAEDIIEYMKKSSDVKKIEYAGSLRRMKETVGDLDILVAEKGDGKKSEKIMDHFIKYPETESVIAKGKTKTSIIMKNGIQADLRVIDEEIFGAAMHYFTGSKEHNVAIRDRAKKMGLKVSEYGVFKIKGKKEDLVAGKTEEEVFKAVKLPYIEPLLRENRGEIEAAEKGKLPKTVEYNDLKGDLHCHSEWSDGSHEIEEVAKAYRDAGFEYIALTDHSQSARIAHGLTPDRYKMQWDEIDEVNDLLEKEAKKGKPAFKILKGTECDILADGQLDLPDSVLKKFDIVVASVHSGFKRSEKEMTERVIKALKNPYVKIWGHPSGRLINQREPYEIDMHKVIKAAIQEGVALEINSQPLRLDLFDYYCKMAKDMGAKFTIDSDSHHETQIKFLNFGVAVAKRGWLEKGDVLNTLPLDKLLLALRN